MKSDKEDHLIRNRFLDGIKEEFDASKVTDPEINDEEIFFQAARDVPDSEHEDYFSDKFRSQYGQYAMRSERLKKQTENRSEFLNKELEKNQRNIQKTPQATISLRKERAETRTLFEKLFFFAIPIIAAISIFVAWNATSTFVRESGEYPTFIDTPILSYLFTFAIVSLSFLAKFHFDIAGDGRKNAFLHTLKRITLFTGVVWLVAFSILYSPKSVETEEYLLDPHIVSLLLVLSQIAVEVGAGALLWIWASLIDSKGRVEVAHPSPAYALHIEFEQEFSQQINESEDLEGRLDGYLRVLEHRERVFIAEGLSRIQGAKNKLEQVKLAAVSQELTRQSNKPGTSTFHIIDGNTPKGDHKLNSFNGA